MRQAVERMRTGSQDNGVYDMLANSLAPGGRPPQSGPAVGVTFGGGDVGTYGVALSPNALSPDNRALLQSAQGIGSPQALEVSTAGLSSVSTTFTVGAGQPVSWTSPVGNDDMRAPSPANPAKVARAATSSTTANGTPTTMPDAASGLAQPGLIATASMAQLVAAPAPSPPDPSPELSNEPEAGAGTSAGATNATHDADDERKDTSHILPQPTFTVSRALQLEPMPQGWVSCGGPVFAPVHVALSLTVVAHPSASDTRTACEAWWRALELTCSGASARWGLVQRRQRPRLLPSCCTPRRTFRRDITVARDLSLRIQASAQATRDAPKTAIARLRNAAQVSLAQTQPRLASTRLG